MRSHLNRSVFLLLFAGILWVVACGKINKPGEESGQSLQTSTQTFTAETVPQLTIQSQETAYPFHPPTETLIAYPEMKQTDTAQVLTQTALPTRTPFPTLPPTPTTTGTPTPFPVSDLLPAPIYFNTFAVEVGAPPSQIWRMERDGYTLTPITHEKDGVSGFDLSSNGDLVFIVNNSLIVTDGWGMNPRVMIKGAEPPPYLKSKPDYWYFEKEEIRSPVWSPDGRKIAYYLDGIHIIDLKTGHIIRVMDGRKMIPGPDMTPIPETERAPIFYPNGWTPDGSQIVVKIGLYESSATAFVAPVENGTLIKVDVPMGGCCDYSFTHDGKMLFSSGDHTTVGLWLVDPLSGKGQRLTDEIKDSLLQGQVVIFPKEASDGRIIFITTRSGSRNPDDWGLNLVFTESKKVSIRIPEDVTFIDPQDNITGELWSPDGTQAIVTEYPSRDLALVKIKDGTIHSFRLSGYNLHWGPKQ